jgi:hypothetical protein
MSVTVIVVRSTGDPVVRKLPSAPAALTSTPSADRTATALAWLPPANEGGAPITGYRVARDGTDSTGGGAYATTLPATARGFRFSLLRPQANYSFTVQAINTVGTGPSATAVMRPPTAPTAPSTPSGVSAVRQQNGTTAVVGWQPPASDGGAAISGYRVTRGGSDSSGGGAYSTVVPATSRSFSFTLLNRTSPYTFTVQAVNQIGTGAAGSVTSPAG